MKAIVTVPMLERKNIGADRHFFRIAFPRLFGGGADPPPANFLCPQCNFVYAYARANRTWHHVSDSAASEPKDCFVEFRCAEQECNTLVIVHALMVTATLESLNDMIHKLTRATFRIRCEKSHAVHFDIRNVVHTGEAPFALI